MVIKAPNVAVISFTMFESFGNGCNWWNTATILLGVCCALFLSSSTYQHIGCQCIDVFVVFSLSSYFSAAKQKWLQTPDLLLIGGSFISALVTRNLPAIFQRAGYVCIPEHMELYLSGVFFFVDRGGRRRVITIPVASLCWRCHAQLSSYPCIPCLIISLYLYSCTRGPGTDANSTTTITTVNLVKINQILQNMLSLSFRVTGKEPSVAEYCHTGGTAGIRDYDTKAAATGGPGTADGWGHSGSPGTVGAWSPPNGAATGSGRGTNTGAVGSLHNWCCRSCWPGQKPRHHITSHYHRVLLCFI